MTRTTLDRTDHHLALRVHHTTITTAECGVLLLRLTGTRIAVRPQEKVGPDQETAIEHFGGLPVGPDGTVEAGPLPWPTGLTRFPLVPLQG